MPLSSDSSQLSEYQEELVFPLQEWVILPAEDSGPSTTSSTDIYEKYVPKPDKMDTQDNTREFDGHSTFPSVSVQTEFEEPVLSTLPVNFLGVEEFDYNHEVYIPQVQPSQPSIEGAAETCELQPDLFAELPPRTVPVGFVPRNQRICEVELPALPPASESLVGCEAMDIDLYQQDPTNFSAYEQVLGDTALFPMPDSHAGYGIGTSSHHDHSINLRFSVIDKRSPLKTNIANTTLRRQHPRSSRMRKTTCGYIDYQNTILGAKETLNHSKEHRKHLYWDTELECLHRGVYGDGPALSPFAKFNELHNSRAPRRFPTTRARRRYAFPTQTPPFNMFPQQDTWLIHNALTNQPAW